MGVTRISKFCRAATQCYTKEAWIMKLDIQGYFMSIDRDILRMKVNDYLSNWENLPWNYPKTTYDTSETDNLDREELRARIEKAFLDGTNRAMEERRNELHYTKRYYGKFPNFLIKVVRDIIYNNPTENWIFRGKPGDYDGLPRTKSLFYAKENCWLPIGNLTSQLFSNVYLNDFDHFVKEVLGIKYYGRYVDDFIMIHEDKDYLLSLKPIIKEYLEREVHLTLHPKKCYIQTVKKGVEFLGARIKPYRIYRAKRTISNFYKMITQSKGRPQRESIDSYLGLMCHVKCWKITQKILSNLDDDRCAENLSLYSLAFLNEEKRSAILKKHYSKQLDNIILSEITNCNS